MVKLVLKEQEISIVCVLKVKKHLVEEFRKKLTGDFLSITDYGEVLLADFGEAPSPHMRDAFKEKYGIDLPEEKFFSKQSPLSV